MIRTLLRTALTPVVTSVLVVGAASGTAYADNTVIPNNSRLNETLVQGVYTLQHRAGCTNDVNLNPQLNQAAQWHTNDLMNNRALDGGIGSDGSTPQDRANAAGFPGTVKETVVINPALAISSMELITRLHNNPEHLAIIQDCSHTVMGVVGEQSGSHRRGSALRRSDPTGAGDQSQRSQP